MENEITTQSGIYMLYWTNKPGFYIGRTYNISTRYKTHLNAFKSGKCCSTKLYQYYLNNGIPLVKTIELADVDDLIDIERGYLKMYAADVNFLNLHTCKIPIRIKPHKLSNKGKRLLNRIIR